LICIPFSHCRTLCVVKYIVHGNIDIRYVIVMLLYHLYYGHNLYLYIPMQYSHLRGMSTKQQYRSYLPKTEYTIKRYCNCLSNISVLVMLIKLYYDLETCGIIIVRQVWYIRIFIILLLYRILRKRIVDKLYSC
jgi:hypothetical protein